MAFCGNCGKELMKGAKFCFNCGKAVAANQNDAMEQRKIIYEGKIYKCPNCGEVLSAFDVMCPSCGYEIRGSKASNSVKEFAMQLANIENDKQKITLIQSYPIPNNKGDILEFMILAATCFEPGENVTGDAAKKDVSYAWYAKVEQSYQKAKILFANDVDFIKIQNVYNQTCNKFKMAASMERKKKIGQLILRTIGLWGGLIALIIAFFIDILVPSTNTSMLHLGGAIIMIIGAFVIGGKPDGMSEVGVGAASGLFALLLGMLLEESFDGNGSMMVTGGVAVLIITVVQLFRKLTRK